METIVRPAIGFVVAALLVVGIGFALDEDEAPASNGIAETSTITCPHCGHQATETLPTEACQIKYDCKGCKATLTPEGDDCCVFCTHGDHKCPSIQELEKAAEP